MSTATQARPDERDRYQSAIGKAHTPESFGRAIIQAAVQAKQENKNTQWQTTTSVVGMDCVQVCVQTPFGTICVCVP